MLTSQYRCPGFVVGIKRCCRPTHPLPITSRGAALPRYCSHPIHLNTNSCRVPTGGIRSSLSPSLCSLGSSEVSTQPRGCPCGSEPQRLSCGSWWLVLPRRIVLPHRIALPPCSLSSTLLAPALKSSLNIPNRYIISFLLLWLKKTKTDKK